MSDAVLALGVTRATLSLPLNLQSSGRKQIHKQIALNSVVLRNKLGKTGLVDQLNLGAKRKEKCQGSPSDTANHFLLLELSLPWAPHTILQFFLSYSPSVDPLQRLSLNAVPEPPLQPSALFSIFFSQGKDFQSSVSGSDLSSNSTFTFSSIYFVASAATGTADSVCRNFQAPKLCVFLLPSPTLCGTTSIEGNRNGQKSHAALSKRNMSATCNLDFSTSQVKKAKRNMKLVLIIY